MSFLYGSFIAFEQNSDKNIASNNDDNNNNNNKDGNGNGNGNGSVNDDGAEYYEYGGYCVNSLSCPWVHNDEDGSKMFRGECQLKRGWLQRQQSNLLKTHNVIQSLLKLSGLSTMIPMGCPSSSPSSSSSSSSTSSNNETTSYNNNSNNDRGGATAAAASAKVVNEVFIDEASFDTDKIQQQRPLSRRFLSYLKQSISSTNATSSTTKKKKITAHIRRGDVNLCTSTPGDGRWFRYLPNKYFLDLIDEYILAMTMATMDDGAGPKTTGRSSNNNNHSSSSSSSSNRQFEVVIHSESDALESFDVFTERGYDVKLDGDARDVWSDILASDVIIMSLSSFSFVPSVLANALSNATVVYHPMNVLPVETFRVIERGSALFRASQQEKIRLNSTLCLSNMKQQQEEEKEKRQKKNH